MVVDLAFSPRMSDAISDDEMDSIIILTTSLLMSGSYSYDGQDRLYRYTNSWNSALDELYTYDAAGNRISLQEGSQAAKMYSYADDNRLASVLRPRVASEDFEDGIAIPWYLP